MRTWFLVTLAVVLATAGGTLAADAPELVVIVNAENAAKPSAADLADIYLRRVAQWSDGTAIVPLNAPPETRPREQFDRVVLGMTPEDNARYWLDQRIRGRAAAPRQIADPHLAVRLVAKLSGAIAYVPADTELDGTRVVARIRNNKVVSP